MLNSLELSTENPTTLVVGGSVEDEFNWCTDFGTQLKLVSDRPYATDGAFVLRTLTFEQTTTNGIVDPRLGVLDENNIPSGRIITDER